MSDATITTDILNTPVPPPPPAAWWEDYVDLMYAPSDVCARRAQSGFFVTMVIVTMLFGLIGLANAGVMQPIMEAEFHRATAVAIRQNPQAAAMMGKMQSIGETSAKIGGFIYPPIGIFLTALALWLVGKITVGSTQTLAAAMMVTSYAYVVKVLESIAGGVQAMLMDPASLTGRYKVSLGVGRFFDPDATSPVLLAVVGRIDVFTIWFTILLAIGLSTTGKVTRQQAAIAAVVLWIVGALPAVLGAARQ